MTRAEVEVLVSNELAECSPEQRAVFEKYRVPAREVAIERYGQQEHVFIVAIRESEAMYYEDVELGFNFSPIGEDGRILQHWCNQDDLSAALWHWMGHPRKWWAGPAQPFEVK